MTGRLIKFEFRSSFRQLLVVWGALLAMTVLMCILVNVTGLDSYENLVHSGQALQLLSGIISVVSWILYIGIFAALVVLTAAIVIARFYRGLLGEEGYLMHTLPVRVWQLITAKGVTTACAVIGSFLVALVSILLISSQGHLPDLFRGLAELGHDMGKEPLLIVLFLEFLVIAVLGILKSIYQIYAAISVGQLTGRHRILASVGAYIGISIALSALAGILFFIADVSGMGEYFGTWIDAHSFILSEDGMSGFGPSQLILLAMFLGEAIQLAAFHLLSERLLTKRLNLL